MSSILSAKSGFGLNTENNLITLIVIAPGAEEDRTTSEALHVRRTYGRDHGHGSFVNYIHAATIAIFKLSYPRAQRLSFGLRYPVTA